MGAAMIMNSNSLPVALLQSLAPTVPGLQLDQNDDLDTIVGRAITYLLLCGTMGQFVSSILGCCVASLNDLSFAGVTASVYFPRLSPRTRSRPLLLYLTRLVGTLENVKANGMMDIPRVEQTLQDPLLLYSPFPKHSTPGDRLSLMKPLLRGLGTKMCPHQRGLGLLSQPCSEAYARGARSGE